MAESPPITDAAASTARLLTGAVLLGLAFVVVAMLLPWVGHLREHPERLPLLVWMIRLAGFGAYAVAGGWVGYQLRRSRPTAPLSAVLRLAAIAAGLLAVHALLLWLGQMLLVAGLPLSALDPVFWLMRGLWTVLALLVALASALLMSRLAARNGESG